MFFHKAELAGYSSVVGQPIMLLNERGACIGQLSLIGYQGDDYKKAVADIADALNEITALRAQLAAAEAKLAKVEAYAEELDQELRDTQDRANAFATKEYYTEMRAERAEAKNKKLALELLAAHGQAADAIRDKLAFGEMVRKKAIRLIDLLSLGRSHSAHKAMVQAIRAIDLDALAEENE